jgi:type I restriction-modification system DNA methylase subunit
VSVPKATEMTIRNFLMKELETRGVKVNTEISYRTPIGRLMPDILLCNGAEYVVETKLGAEAKLLDAMVQLYDYSKYTPTNGGFAVLFPKELRRPWGIEIIEKIVSDPKLKYIATATFKDNRASQRFVGNLSEMADWIATHVLRAPSVEADTGFAINVLTEAVEALTASVRALKETELEDIFGGKTVFENILQYEEGRYPLDEMKQAATYLLANQIIFYHVLSKMDLAFEDIDEDEIGKPNDLLSYFNPVLDKDYSSIFGFDVASRLPDSSTKIIKKVIMAVKALAPEKIGHDVLGKVFHELIPFNIRKSVAAFYTNNEAAEILAQLSIDDPDAKVMDLAVGSGTLLVAAYRRKRELKKKLGTYDLSKDHRKFLEEDLTGIDIMPFAAHLAVMHLSLQALLSETEKVRVAVWDSTELKPSMNIPAIHKELKAAYKRPTLDMFKEGSTAFLKDAFIKKGAITLEGLGGEEIPLKKADLVIMNPPFTRQERLPKQYKTSLSKRLKEYEEYIHGQLGLHGYFIFLADRFTKKNGRIALVLPATTLRVMSTSGIRKLLTSNYEIEHIITTWQRAAFSESAQFREILLLAKKTGVIKEKSVGNNKKKECIVTTLNTLPKSLKEARVIAKQLKLFAGSDDRIFKNQYMKSYKVSQNRLEERQDNLFILISVGDPSLIDLWMDVSSRKSKLTVLYDYLKEKGELRRGIETAHGIQVQPLTILSERNMAIKKSDIWIAKSVQKNSFVVQHRFLNKEFQIPLKAVSRCLRRISGINCMNISDRLDYVVTGNFPQFKEFLEASIGKTDTSFIKKWRRYVKERLGNLVVVRRMDISAPGSYFLAFYSSIPEAPPGIAWSFKLRSSEDAKILSLWMNSSLNILQTLLNRKETRGAFLQIDKYVLNDFLILDPCKLSEAERNQLSKIADKIGQTEFPSILEQLKNNFPLRIEIDKVILRTLGFEDGEISNMLNYLHSSLANEIEQLKKLMTG